MESSFITTIIIATVAIIPGLMSLAVQKSKDSREAELEMQRFINQTKIKKEIFNIKNNNAIEKPKIEYLNCQYCGSKNSSINSCCTQCGAPLKGE